MTDRPGEAGTQPPPSVLATCCLTGALGIASGYAVWFLTIDTSDDPDQLAVALLIATVVAVTFEWLRHKIEIHHSGFWSRALVTLVFVASAEFFVMAWDAVHHSLHSDDVGAGGAVRRCRGRHSPRLTKGAEVGAAMIRSAGIRRDRAKGTPQKARRPSTLVRRHEKRPDEHFQRNRRPYRRGSDHGDIPSASSENWLGP